jgi:hypothetical protein
MIEIFWACRLPRGARPRSRGPPRGSGYAALAVAEDARALLRPGDDAQRRLLELRLADRVPAVSAGEQRRLVEQVREVGAGEAGRRRGGPAEVDVGGEGLAARVHLEDPPAGSAVGALDRDLAVEAARAQEGRVDRVGPVGRGDDD